MAMKQILQLNALNTRLNQVSQSLFLSLQQNLAGPFFIGTSITSFGKI